MNARFSVFVLALASASFLAPGCGGGGAHAPLRIELAPTLDCTQESADFPPDLRFFTVQICPSAGGECALLTDPSGDHGGGTTLLRVARSLDRRFTLDARLDGGMDYDVTITGYSGAETGTCAPYALGHSFGVRFGQGEVRVRLYPLGGWSCAGTHEGQASPVGRALHQAVLLPNHEVLLLGGIEGPQAGAVAFARQTLAQRVVEVFDPTDSRFHTVTIADEDGVDGFSRVMFEARYVTTTASGQYEIHTYGGFDIGNAPEGGLGFDGNANATTVSALFGPLSQMMTGTGAGFRSDAVILYDPATRTATVTTHAGGTYTTSAASEGPTNIGVVRGITSVTVPTTGTGYPTYALSAGWYVDGGRQDTLLAGRLGTSITPISPTNFLVWGGHVVNGMNMALTAAEVTGNAGEVVSSMTAGNIASVAAHDATVVPDDGRPLPTAYHTATRIAGPTGSTSILFAGGLVLGVGPAPLGTDVADGPPAPPETFTVTRFATDGSVVGGERIAGPSASTVLHTATAVDASATSVLIVGGASIPSAMTSTLFAEKATGVVTFTPSTSTYAWHALPDLVSGRWGHTTTVIPGHGVLVVGGLSRAAGTLTVSDSAEFLLWEDLVGTGRPTSMDCAMAADAGPSSMDAGARDTGARDTGASTDTDVDAGASDDAAAATD